MEHCPDATNERHIVSPRKQTARSHRGLAQDTADGARSSDAELRSQTIVGDEDAHWLIRQVEGLQRRTGVIRSGAVRTFHFLPRGAEAVIDNVTSSYTVITMPPGSIVSKASGTGYRSWVFRVENGMSGSDLEYFELEYRKIATDAHMLCLMTHGFGERRHK